MQPRLPPKEQKTIKSLLKGALSQAEAMKLMVALVQENFKAFSASHPLASCPRKFQKIVSLLHEVLEEGDFTSQPFRQTDVFSQSPGLR